MSSNDTMSDSQLSNVRPDLSLPDTGDYIPELLSLFQVSLGLSQDTTNQLLSAVGFNCPSISDW